MHYKFSMGLSTLEKLSLAAQIMLWECHLPKASPNQIIWNFLTAVIEIRSEEA